MVSHDDPAPLPIDPGTPFPSKVAISRHYQCSERIVHNWANEPTWPAVWTVANLDRFLANINSDYARGGKRRPADIGHGDFFTLFIAPLQEARDALLRRLDRAMEAVARLPAGRRDEAGCAISADCIDAMHAVDRRMIHKLSGEQFIELRDDGAERLYPVPAGGIQDEAIYRNLAPHCYRHRNISEGDQ